MACKVKDILESGSLRYSLFVYPFADYLRIEMKISLNVNFRSVCLKYMSRACSLNITRSAKMMVEHVDPIAKKGTAYRRFTDWASRTWVPGLVSLFDFFSSLSQQ